MSSMHTLSRRVPLAGRVALGALFLTLALPAQDVDPPSRVARLNLIEGSVSMQPAGSDQWVPGVINRPFTIGDYIYTDVDSRAELHFDAGVLRMGPQTSFGLLNFDDGIAQISLVEGSLNLHVRRLSPNDVLEVDTPNAAVTVTAPGDYRISVNPDDQTSFVAVRAGNADITGGNNGFSLEGGQSAQLSGSDYLAYNFGGLPDPDDFDQFCFNRDRRELAFHPRYVSVDMIGAEDLDENGSWSQQPGVGAVWYPRTVAAGWAPYRYGHWAWIEPWGWTWVDDASWGFAPFHYGRWAFVGGRWGWTPGPVAVGVAERPVYAPAMVAFFGGGGFSLSIDLGGGPSLGWVPLGPGEYYTPSYHVSAAYFTQVNVSNTVIQKNVNITNIYNITYVNRGAGAAAAAAPPRVFANVQAPNAVTVISQSAMASGQTVSRAGQSLPKQDLAHLQSAHAGIVAPPVAPTRAALALGMGAGKASAPHPPAQLIAKPLFAKAAPPPPPIPFAKKQQFLDSHAGQPFNKQELRASVPKSAAPPAVAVHKVSPQAVAASHQKPSPQNAGKPSPPNAMNAKPATANTQPKSTPQGITPNKGEVTRPGEGAKENARETPSREETTKSPAAAKTLTAPAPEVRKVTPSPTPAAAKAEPKEAAPAKAAPAPAPEVRKVTPSPAAKPEPKEAAPAKTTPAPEARKVTPPPAAKPEPKEAAPAKTTKKTTKGTEKETEKK